MRRHVSKILLILLFCVSTWNKPSSQYALGAGAGGGPDVSPGAEPQKAPVPKQCAGSEFCKT